MRRDKEQAARAMLAVLDFIDGTFGVIASGGSRSRPTVAQLNDMWDRVRYAKERAAAAGIKAE